MERSAKQAPARAGLALGGAALLAGCLLGNGNRTASLEGYFGNRLEGLPREQQLDSSLLALELMKGQSGGIYRYRRASVSWTGHRSESWIWVRGGKVVRRTYNSSALDGAGKEVPVLSYDESGGEVGGHSAGYPAVTLDSLYRTCREALKADSTTHRLHFSLDRDYILSVCGSVHRFCIDDCPPQVQIEVRWD